MGLPGTALTPDSPLKEAESNCPLGSRLSGRGRRLEVLDDVIEFLVELLERIPSTVKVVAEVSHERRRVRCLLEFRLGGAEQLRRFGVEFRAVGALDRPGRGQCDQVLPLQRDVRLAELELLEQLPASAQGELVPLEVVEEARNKSEGPLDVFQRLLLRHDVTSSRAMQASGTSNAPPSARGMIRNSSPPLIPSRREKSRRVRTRDPVDIRSEVYSGFLQGRSSRSLVGPRDFASLTKSTSPTCCESSARSTRVAARSAREMWYGPWRRSFPPT